MLALCVCARVLVLLQWCFDCSPAVAEAMKATINRLVQLGAKQVDITLPDLHLAQVRSGASSCHAVGICSTGVVAP